MRNLSCRVNFTIVFKKLLKIKYCAFHAIFLLIIVYYLLPSNLFILLLQARIDLKRQVSSYSGPSIEVVLNFIRESTVAVHYINKYLTNAYKIICSSKTNFFVVQYASEMQITLDHLLFIKYGLIEIGRNLNPNLNFRIVNALSK